MKKFIIFFILLVSLTTIALTLPTKIAEESIISNSELTTYKDYLSQSSMSEKEINKRVKEYKKAKIKKAKESGKDHIDGMEFKEAFKTSLIFCSVLCSALLITYFTKNAHYDELFTDYSSTNNKEDDYITNSPIMRLRRFFSKMWF